VAQIMVDSCYEPIPAPLPKYVDGVYYGTFGGWLRGGRENFIPELWSQELLKKYMENTVGISSLLKGHQ